MSETFILFEDPTLYPAELPFLSEGGSPKFVRFLQNYLTKNKLKIENIRIAIYLFNNFSLHRLFLDLAKSGIQIHVVSIPPDGYDPDSPQYIFNSDGSKYLKNKHSKFSLAQFVYTNFTEKPPENYNLSCFPHTYIRSKRVKPFSRGTLPYSLHTKFMEIRMLNGRIMVGITSSNLSLRDKVKHDFFVMKEVSGDDALCADLFFQHLIGESIPVTAIKAGLDLSYQTPLQQLVAGGSLHPVAPFYNESPGMAESLIKGLLKNAQKRIWIMAQHLSAYLFRDSPENNEIRNGILHTVIEKGQEGVEIRCISQTYSGPAPEGKTFREPQNRYNFREFIREFRKLPVATYAVNENVHSKYILIDDLVIITTFNYTPTQFIYLPEVNINSFENMKGVNYRGVFCEVGHLMVLRKKGEMVSFKRNFEYVLKDPLTVTVFRS